MTRWCTIATLTFALAGCGGAAERPKPGRPAPVEPFDDDATGVSQAAGPSAIVAPRGDPEPATSAHDDPHISRSVGREGGLIVFWPRVIPKSEAPELRALAAELQARLVAIGHKKFAEVDVRPEPERVCPRVGCKASTLGVLLTHRDGGCTAVALWSRPGASPTHLVPWAGTVKLKAEEVPFRDYPESQLIIVDAVPCNDLLAALATNEAKVAATLE